MRARTDATTGRSPLRIRAYPASHLERQVRIREVGARRRAVNGATSSARSGARCSAHEGGRRGYDAASGRLASLGSADGLDDRHDLLFHAAVDGHADTLSPAVASADVLLDSLTEGRARRRDAHRSEEVVVHLVELRFDERVVPRVDLRCQPEHLIPEVIVDPRQGARVDDPGRFVPVRNVPEDQVDFGRSSDDEHVAGVITESIPLPDQWIQRSDQPWELWRQRREGRC